MSSTCFKLTRIIDSSQSREVALIIEIWEIVILKPEATILIAKLVKELSNIVLNEKHILFKDSLAKFLLIIENYSEKVCDRLGQVMRFVSELFVLEIVSDEFMTIWFQAELTDKISLAEAAQLSSLLEIKLQNSDDLNLKLLFMSFEENINKKKADCLIEAIELMNNIF